MIKLKKLIKEDIDTEATLKEYTQLIAQFELAKKRVKELEGQIEPLTDVILPLLEQSESKIIESENYIAKIEKSGYERKSPKYKEAYELSLTKVNAAIKNILEECLKATTGVTKVAPKISVLSKGVNEGAFDRISGYFKSIAQKIGLYNKQLNASTLMLKKLANIS